MNAGPQSEDGLVFGVAHIFASYVFWIHCGKRMRVVQVWKQASGDGHGWRMEMDRGRCGMDGRRKDTLALPGSLSSVRSTK